MLKRMFFGEIPLAVARSLRDAPEQWTGYFHPWGRKYYHLNRGPVELWTGNSSYGMGVEVGREKAWGDVTALSSFGLSPGHWLLRIAADRWIKAHPHPDTMRPKGPSVAELLRRDQPKDNPQALGEVG